MIDRGRQWAPNENVNNRTSVLRLREVSKHQPLPVAGHHVLARHRREENIPRGGGAGVYK